MLCTTAITKLQTWWLLKYNFYSLTVLEIWSPKSVSLSQNEGLIRAILPWKALGCFQFLKLQSLANSLFLSLQNQWHRPLLHCPLASWFCVKSPFTSLLKGHLGFLACGDNPGQSYHPNICNLVTTAKSVLTYKVTFTGSRN